MNSVISNLKLPEYDETVVAKKHYSIEMLNSVSMIVSRDVTIPIVPRPILIGQQRIGIIPSVILSSVDMKHSALKCFSTY